MSEVTQQGDVKVEWDPERYEESMAALRAWGDEDWSVKFDKHTLLLTRFSYRIIFEFKENGTIYAEFTNKDNFTLYFNNAPYYQYIETTNTTLQSSIRILSISNKCQSLRDISSLSSLTQLTFLKLENCKSLSDINALSSLTQLRALNLSGCESLSDLSPLATLTQLISLDLSDCKSLSDLTPLAKLTQLTKLDIFWCKSLSDLTPLATLTQLKALNLSSCELLSDLTPLATLTQLRALNLSGCESLIDLSPLATLTQLTSLDIRWCKSLSDLTPLAKLTQLSSLNLSACELLSLSPLATLTQLTKLDIFWCKSLSDLSPLATLTQLTALNLSRCESLSDLTPLATLAQLTSLDLSDCKSLSDLSPLATLTQLTALNLSGCESLSDLSALSSLTQLTALELAGCQSLSDLSALSSLTQLNSLSLGHTSLSDMNALSSLTQLTSLNLSECESLTNLTPLSALTKLQSLNLNNCGEIHSLDPLLNLPNLKKLTWITPSKTSEVLLSSALLRQDQAFIREHASDWLEHFSLSKEPEPFFRRLGHGLALINNAELFEELAERGRVFSSKQLDLRAWRGWAQHILNLTQEAQSTCFTTALAELNTLDSLEGRGAGVIGAMGQLAHTLNRPAWALELVERTLQHPLEDDEKRRTIAPAAASFYAQWGDEQKVRAWIAYGTHPEAPLWRDRVLLALVEQSAQTRQWAEVSAYLAMIETLELRDQAHLQLGRELLTDEPIRVAVEHLSQINDPALQQHLALELCEVEALYQSPRALSHLMLTLQANPDDLSRLLKRLVQTSAEAAETIKALFGINTAPTATAEHPALTALKEAPLETMNPMEAQLLLWKLKGLCS